MSQTSTDGEDCGRVREVTLSELANEKKDALGPWLGKTLGVIASAQAKQILDPKENCLELKYGFGDLIVSAGRFQPPCGANPNDCSPCQQVMQQASFGHIPLVAVLEGTAEVYIETTQHHALISIPLRMFEPGELFGVFETLERKSLGKGKGRPPRWSVSAGARSVHLLWSSRGTGVKAALVSKICEKAKKEDLGPVDETLRKFTWNDIYAQSWRLIRAVERKWYVRILLVPPTWLRVKGLHGRRLWFGLYKLGWNQSRLLRESAAAQVGNERYCTTPEHKGINPLYFNRTLMHVLAIANGEAPAFVPVLPESYQAGPFEAFQKFLLGTGLTGDNFPALVQPAHLSADRRVGYYSIPWPTLVGQAPKHRGNANFAESLVSDIEEMNVSGEQPGHALTCIGRKQKASQEEFVPATERGRLQWSHTFFTGCVRIVREG